MVDFEKCFYFASFNYYLAIFFQGLAETQWMHSISLFF